MPISITSVTPFTLGHGAIGVDATVFTKLIPPYVGSGGPNLFSHPKRNFGQARTVVQKICYTTGDTAHVISMCRPFNYTYAVGAVAKNTSTLVIYDDPGVYSTNYKWPIAAASNIPSNTADNAIATNDYIAVQLADGTFHFTKVTVSTLTLTLTTALPNPTGVGGVLDGAIVYFYGALVTDVDPATGNANPKTTIALSTTRDVTWADSGVGVVDALHKGDPLIFYSPNTTHAGTLEFVSGYYTKE